MVKCCWLNPCDPISFSENGINRIRDLTNPIPFNGSIVSDPALRDLVAYLDLSSSAFLLATAGLHTTLVADSLVKLKIKFELSLRRGDENKERALDSATVHMDHLKDDRPESRVGLSLTLAMIRLMTDQAFRSSCLSHPIRTSHFDAFHDGYFSSLRPLLYGNNRISLLLVTSLTVTGTVVSF